MTHCDKKPRGKVGGSAISVYQALLPPAHREPGDEAILVLNSPEKRHMTSPTIRAAINYKELLSSVFNATQLLTSQVIVIPCMQRLHQFYQPEPEGES